MTNSPPDINELMDQAGQELSRERAQEQVSVVQQVRDWLNQGRRSLGVFFIAGVALAWATQGQPSVVELSAEARHSMMRVANQLGLEANVHFRSARLEELVEDLRATSPTFRVYYEAMYKSGDHQIVFTSMEEAAQLGDRTRDRKSSGRLGTADYIQAPYMDGSRQPTVEISINLDRFDEKYADVIEVLPEFEEELVELKRLAIQNIIGHEVGHGVSMVLTEGEEICPDPKSLQSTVGCSLARENTINAEIGFPHNRTYGQEGPHNMLALKFLEEARTEKLEQLIRLVRERNMMFSGDAYRSLMDWWHERVQQLHKQQSTEQAPPSPTFDPR